MWLWEQWIRIKEKRMKKNSEKELEKPRMMPAKTAEELVISKVDRSGESVRHAKCHCSRPDDDQATNFDNAPLTRENQELGNS